MSPLDYGPSDIKNPTGVAYVHVPESYWTHRCLVFGYEGLFTDPSDPLKVSPAEGLADFLQVARRLNIRLGLYSSLPDREVVDVLSNMEVASCFDSIRCSGDVEHLPPAPDLYQITLETLGVGPDRILQFEARKEGVDYAKSFGVYTVGVDRGKGAPPGCDFPLKSFAAQSLPDLLEAVDRVQRRALKPS